MKNIKTRNVGNLANPKNYSKKGMICSCLCNISDINYNVLEKNIQISYEVEPNMNRLSNTFSNRIDRWVNNNRNISYKGNWGEFKKIVELPKIFDNLNEDDFIIKIGYFTRDKILMPLVGGIEIINIQKYQMIKTKENRRKKLINISNNENL